MTIARRIGAWVAAWLAAVALWMVLSDSVRPSELLVGAAVAALAAIAFELVRSQRVAAQAVRPQWTLRAWRMLPRLVPDVGRLTRAAFVQLVRREPVLGRVVAIEFGHGQEEPEDRARRAVAVGLGSMAPNTILIGVDPDSGLLLGHQLDPTGKPSDLDPMKLR